MLHVSCYSLPKEVEESPEDAGNNKSEPEKVLNHYKGKNREKYKAACFLIANMKIFDAEYTSFLYCENYQEIVGMGQCCQTVEIPCD